MTNAGTMIRKLPIHYELSIDFLKKIIGINNIRNYEVDATRLESNAVIALVNFFEWLL